MPLLTARSDVAHQAATILGLVGGLFLVVGLGLAYAGRRTRKRRAAFAARGTPAQGEVVENVWKDLGHRGEVSLLAFPRLRYRLPDGTQHEELSFEGASPPVAKPGQAVEVLYDPDDPRRVRVAKDSFAQRNVPGAVMAMGVVFALLGAGMLAGAIALAGS